MSDGTTNFPGRTTAPETPTSGRFKWWHNLLTGLPQYTNGAGETKVFGGTFGTEFALAKKESEETYNQTTYITYLNTNWQNIDFENGTYRVEVKFVWGISTAASSFKARLRIGSNTWGREFYKETKDSSDENIDLFVGYIQPGDFSQSGLQVQLQYAVESAGNTATMYDAYITIWRVS